MSPIGKRALRVLILLAVSATSLFACAGSGGPISGRVLEEGTGRPIRDAIVVVHWEGNWTRIALESSSGCYHVETARTDGDGTYRIARWRQPWSLNDLRRTSDGETFNVYKPGYVLQRMDAATNTLYMAAHKGSVAAYFERVLTRPSWSCSGARASRKNEYRLWEAMAGEAEALAETPDQRGHAWMLRKLTEESLVNLDKPNGISESGRLENIDPHDRLKVEEVPR